MDTGEETQTEYETFCGGCGDTITVRLYDKIKECFKAPDALEKLNDLYAVMGVREHLTRIEFELRREWLNEYRINTVVDFYANLPSVIRYLTDSYFRVLPQLYDDYVKQWKTNKIQREPLTSLKAEFDYSEIVQARRDLMIDEEEEGEG